MGDWAVIFPDAAALFIGQLEAGLAANAADAVTVHGKVPNPRPDRFVVIRRMGGPRRLPMVDEPTLQVDSWALTDADADDLAQLVRAVLHGLRGAVVDDVTIYRVAEMGGPGQMPDSESDQPRVRQNFAALLRSIRLASQA